MRDVGGPSNSLGWLAFAGCLALAALLAALVLVIFFEADEGDEGAGGVAAAQAQGPVAAGSATAIAPSGQAAPFADETSTPAEPAEETETGVAARPAEPGPAGAERSGASEASPPDDRPPAPARRPPTTIVWVERGEQVEILDSPGGSLIERQGDETEFGSPSVFAVQRRPGDWLGVSTPVVPNGELGWIRADPDVLQEGFVSQSVVVDLSERSASLYVGDDRARSWPVTVGAEPSTTPIGTFAVTDTFRGGLNAAYGCCAIALSATQPNLPAGWTGDDRIAFHGTGGPLGIAASLGCIRSADEDMIALLKAVPLGTPVTIRA